MAKTKTEKTETTTTSDDAKSIARLIAGASSPQQRGVATRKLNAYLKLRESEGKNPKQVHASIKSLVTKLNKAKVVSDDA